MRVYRPPLGTHIKDLETPCLLVDLDDLQHNLRTISDLYSKSQCKMREHAKNIKSPVIARMQIDFGGTVGGVCCAKISEAEVMIEGGVEDILITSEVVSEEKIERMCWLAKTADIKICVDDLGNLRDISRVACRVGSSVGILIEVDTSMRRAGVREAEYGIQLARAAVDLPGVKFLGVMSHQTVSGRPDRETRMLEGRRYMEMCLKVKREIESTGIPVKVVSTGETWSYDVAPYMPEITEVEGGTYALMGTNCSYLEEFRVAAKVLSTVISVPRKNVAVGDVGVRALAGPGGVLPTLVGHHEIAIKRILEGSILMESRGPMPFVVGDQFLLHSAQQDVMVNRWNQFIAVRNEVVVAVWEISARGCHH